MSGATATRCPRRSLVVLVGDTPAGEDPARLLAESLDELGIETMCLGREENARRIAAIAAEQQADAIEVCLAGRGVILLRELLRELIAMGRRDISIVVHRAGHVAPTASRRDDEIEGS